MKFPLWALLVALPAAAYVQTPDISYDVVDQGPLRLDVFLPSRPSARPRPALAFIHGGCFNAGSRKDIPEEIKRLADEGFTVFSIGYRLSTVAKYPAALSDVQQGIRFIRKNADRFQVDPNRIAVHGESAGGYLAAMLGVRPLPTRTGKLDSLSSRVQLVTDWYGRTDFTATQATGTDCAESFLGVPRSPATMEVFRRASVLSYVDQNAARFFIVHGTNDQQVYPRHSTLLANLLWAKGRSADLVFFENENHGFPRAIPWALTRNALLEFAGARLRPLPTLANVYQLSFELLLQHNFSGPLDLELRPALGPKVSVLTGLTMKDFDLSDRLQGKVGLIGQGGPFTLKLNAPSASTDLSAVRLQSTAQRQR